MIQTKRLAIVIPEIRTVSGLLVAPDEPTTLFVMAHGAGAGMNHSFMEAVASDLCGRRIATLRYQFPYVEAGSRRPDRPPVAHATVRAAVATAAQLLPGIPLLAGGKSFGASMTTQAQADQPLPGVVGLVAFGFPLHPSGKPSAERGQHLAAANVPMLFLQGERDTLADIGMMAALARELGPRATLHILPSADHSFHVPVRSGRTDAQMLGEACDAMAEWAKRLTAVPGKTD
jgi:predicted alpha/beta-hydrolase family hydrolase